MVGAMAEQELAVMVMSSMLAAMGKEGQHAPSGNLQEPYIPQAVGVQERITVAVVELMAAELVPTGMLLGLEGTEILTRVLVEAEAAAGITVALVDLA